MYVYIVVSTVRCNKLPEFVVVRIDEDEVGDAEDEEEEDAEAVATATL